MNPVDAFRRALLADQVVHRFASSQADTSFRIDQIVDLVVQGDHEKAFPLFRKLYTELQGFASPGTRARFDYLARKPGDLRETLDRLLEHRNRQQQRQEQSSPIKPAVGKLIRNLEEVQVLRNTVLRSPGAGAIAPWLESLEIAEALDVLRTFVAE